MSSIFAKKIFVAIFVVFWQFCGITRELMNLTYMYMIVHLQHIFNCFHASKNNKINRKFSYFDSINFKECTRNPIFELFISTSTHTLEKKITSPLQDYTANRKNF